MQFRAWGHDPIEPAIAGELMPARGNGQDWLVAWHSATVVPGGTPHGAAGICVGPQSELILISHDGTLWGFPAGRPEGPESPEQTLRREVREEACARVVSARLLGFALSECVRGAQRGTVLVRSYWRADVLIDPWNPNHEIRHRRIVAAADALREVRDPDHAATRISHRALIEAGLSQVAD